jgi:hypothetical protein
MSFDEGIFAFGLSIVLYPKNCHCNAYASAEWRTALVWARRSVATVTGRQEVCEAGSASGVPQ